MADAPNDDPMQGRVSRFADMKQNGTPVMFIDSVLPGHYRMNYSVIGDTASENPDFSPMITVPHKFQIGMFEAPPGNGPGWHTHTYVEMFVPLTGRWRFCYGLDGENPDDLLGEYTLEPWDAISGAASRMCPMRTRGALPSSIRTITSRALIPSGRSG
jgi:hypothetical protein